MPENLWDVVIVGAGPAGLMAAISCASGGLRTLVLEGKERIGAKLLISGGGRCNVTNLNVTERDYQSGQPRTVRNILRTFPVEQTLRFFKALGVEMVLEEGTKYFTRAQSAKVVLQALLGASRHAGVLIESGRKVQTLARKDGVFQVTGEHFQYRSRAVVIATGGLSYPSTGSDGSGYGLAKSLGHSIVPTTPALTPLLTDDPDWKSLAGITLPVGLALGVDKKKIAESSGAFLFTHIGFSGPAVLDISGAWVRFAGEGGKLVVNFLPGRKEGDLSAELFRTLRDHPGRSLKKCLTVFLPERLVEVLLKKGNLDPAARLDQVPKKSWEVLLQLLFRSPIPVTGAQGYDKAEVTAGGVDLGEVDPKSLESRLCPGLFFAGEVLDVDGRVGGFNLQWAWSSGREAGRSVVHFLQEH